MMTRIFLMMVLVISCASAHSNTDQDGEKHPAIKTSSSGDLFSSGEELSSLSRISSLLGRYNMRASMTCDEFPRVCRAQGSPGPDCCRKQCVNVMTDNLNCGKCGMKCRYGEACCGGNCVNVMYDHKNCGGCKNRCKKGSFCQYGMCSYA